MPKAVGKKTESRLLSILFVSATSIKGNDSLGNTKNFSTPTGFSKGEESEIMTDDYKLFVCVCTKKKDFGIILLSILEEILQV